VETASEICGDWGRKANASEEMMSIGGRGPFLWTRQNERGAFRTIDEVEVYRIGEFLDDCDDFGIVDAILTNCERRLTSS
jgi:hypothetical protein